ncbi:hypothetical protein IHV10_13585 [Fictibacillus sp. 5RED26]|uniref:hypothetical protein n=1 Tax=Fictibacillus sp. 5RED26 TaxID=2745876 RepID=UPI0018CE264D|nr:hypothetical protein [Fictibacillus sp. 5RED26]MBH0157406.1 hypothetical protein [Fictibacillus sp. 5RED26]
MDIIFITLFLLGFLIIILGWYRKRNEQTKHYTWLSYISIGLSITLILLMYNLKGAVLAFSMAIGSPIAFVFSLVSLFMKNEKILLASIGLLISIILIGIVTLAGIFIFTPGKP